MNENDDIFTFGVSTEEDLRFRLTFTNRSFTGRTLAINIRERETNVLKTTLTAPSRITVVNSGPIPGFPAPPADNDVTASLPKSLMAGWATGQYEADLLDLTVGSATRIVPVRFQLDIPGKLVYGVEGSQATITVSDENQAIVSAVGGVGLPGPANTLEPGTINMLPPGSTPIIEITGDPPFQTLSISVPVGDTGDQGIAGQIISVDAVSSAPGTSPDVANLGTPEQAELLFTIPTGDQGDHGWSPILATASDGARRVLRVVDWTGGEGAKPTLTGYIGASGIVVNIGDGIDIRGEPGASVGPGSIGTPELANGAVTEIKVNAIFLDTILRDTDLAELVAQTSITGAAKLPVGTTAQRPVTPAVGYVRWNSTTSEYEGGNGTAWVPIGGSGGAKRGDIPPTANVRDTDLWFNESLGALFIYLIDAGETDGQWISTTPIIDPSVFMLKGDNLSGLANVSVSLDNLGFTALGKTLRAVADAAAGRAAINAPPLPQTASGVGQWLAISSGDNVALVLPAGGTWAYLYAAYDVSTGGLRIPVLTGSVAAGGTTVRAGVSGQATAGVSWRIS